MGDQFTIAGDQAGSSWTSPTPLGLAHASRRRRGRSNLDGEWPWLAVYPGLSDAVGEEITPETGAEELRGDRRRHGVKVEPGWDAEKLVMELFGEIVEPTLIQPTFVCDYPPSAQPLARPHRRTAA